MRRTGSLKVCITLVIITTLSLITRQAWGKYGGGSGTAEDPYLIYTAEQMNSIGLYYEDSDKYFKATVIKSITLTTTSRMAI